MYDTDTSNVKKDGLSFIGLTGLAVGSTIASGVFSFSGDFAAQGAGTAAVLIGWLIAGLGMFSLAMCFFGLNKARPELTGGISAYAAAGFGDYVGFNSAWGYWLSALLGNVSFVTLLFAALGQFFPAFGEGNNLVSTIGGSALIWFLVWLILRGVKSASLVNLIVTFAKLIPIFVFVLAVIVVKAFDFDIFMNNFWGEDTGIPLFEQIKATTYTTVWVFIGIEGAVVISGRARKSSDVGKATVTAFVCVLLIYVLVSALSMGVLPREELATLPNPPLAAILEYAVGPWGGVVINIGVIISILGALLGFTIIAAECAWEAAEQGSFSKIFAATNKNEAPSMALIITNLLVQAFLIILYFNSSTYQIFYIISASMSMVPYLLSAMYYLKLCMREEYYLERGGVGKVGAWIFAIIGTIYGFWMIYSGGFMEFLITGLLYAPGTLIYIKGRKEQGKPIFSRLFERILMMAIGIMFIASVVVIANGTYNPFS